MTLSLRMYKPLLLWLVLSGGCTFFGENVLIALQKQPSTPAATPEPTPAPPNLDMRDRSLSLDRLQQDILDPQRQQLREAERRRKLEEDRRKIYKRDVGRLLYLATTTQEYVTTSGAARLSPEMVSEAERAVRVAHELREAMAEGSLPKPKKDAQLEGGQPAPGDSAQVLAGKVSHYVELATSLKQNMDHYLDPQTQNTISIGDLHEQQREKKPAPSPLFISMMNSAEELEKLSLEFAHSK
jgi:hypothetical protein